jgi:rod shape determining protein RodA
MNTYRSSRLRTGDSTGLRKKIPLLERFHVDKTLLYLLLLMAGYGLFILYSAGSQDPGLFEGQVMRSSMAFGLMFVMAQIQPRYYYLAVPWLYTIGILLLIAVLLVGDIGKGAQRWLDLKFIRFQPSELMKLMVPMMIAYYFSERPLPCTAGHALIAGFMIIIPALLIAKQPDLGTALLIIASGLSILFLAGISWRYIITIVTLGGVCAPVLWHFMHDYQRKRIMMFLNPETDPLGSGYNIIQSQIAIGSGGFMGKGWLEGTQSHLEFLPEHATDFVFAVISEELGFVGVCLLLLLYTFILIRCANMSGQAHNTFTKLLSGSITLTFAIYIIINIGMVSGVLPVVGIPLPLVSYGGTSIVTLMAGFGIIMSIYTHRHLVSE